MPLRSATSLDGAGIAARVHAGIRYQVATMSAPPCLATVRLTADGADSPWDREIRKQCAHTGIRVRSVRWPRGAADPAVPRTLDALAADPAVTGILPEFPYPEDPDVWSALSRIPLAKDVSGCTEEALARLAADRPGLRPVTAAAVLALLDKAGRAVPGARAVVVGARRHAVAQARMLGWRGVEATVCAHGPVDCGDADIVVVAEGATGLDAAPRVRPGAVLVDARSCPPADPTAAQVRVAAVAMVLHNTVTAAQRFAPREEAMP